PFEFDYKTYLSNRQIHYMSFIDSTSFAETTAPSPLSLWWRTGLYVKQYILNNLKNSGLTQEAYAISAALLTGYDHDINSSVMEAFSHSGTLHVLSVSGLHTGLIYVVLSFLFDLIDRKKNYKMGKFIFITCGLWFFALITGFSAPVLRAVIMFNLLGFGKIFFRNDFRNQINILLVSAFMLLFQDPYLLTDIGFQLSYFALFGILFFQPVFMNVWQPEKKYQVFVWQSVTASFAATLTTLPLTLFYFKQFPFWFFITNLLVVPATFGVLILALLVVLKINKVALIINAIIKFLIYFIGLFNVPLVGFIDNIHFQLWDALLLSLFIIGISMAVNYRSYKQLVFSFTVLIFWQINGLCISYFLKNENIFSVYHLKKQYAYSIKNKQVVQLSKLKTPDYNFHVKPHVNSFNYPVLKESAFNYVKYKDKCFLILNKKNRMPFCNYNEVSTLIISDNFDLRPRHLNNFAHLKTIVSDGSNNPYVIKHLAELCSKFDLVFYDTKTKGAYLETL
ncbi:MAG: hypothetical protein JWO32_820, partial [Bacteroidetes bacterium]|nr:hypothetical protein [Bacteroidota bacterium]